MLAGMAARTPGMAGAVPERVVTGSPLMVSDERTRLRSPWVMPLIFSRSRLLLKVVLGCASTMRCASAVLKPAATSSS
ncbi:hypothetical protein D3C85_1625520 [compost metagenome]